MKTLLVGLFFTLFCVSAQAMTTTVVRQDVYAFLYSGKLAIGEDRATIVVKHDRISNKKQRTLRDDLGELLESICEDTSCDLRDSPNIKDDVRAIARQLRMRVISIKISYEKWPPTVLGKK